MMMKKEKKKKKYTQKTIRVKDWKKEIKKKK